MASPKPDDPLARALEQWMGARVTVHVSPERFTFSYRDQIVALATYVCVAKKDDELEYVGFGEQVPGAVRVDLFRESGAVPAGIDKMDCLAELCRYGFSRVLGGVPIFRPTVSVSGASTLEPLLHGYQHVLLEEALLDAGGRDIQFDDADEVRQS